MAYLGHDKSFDGGIYKLCKLVTASSTLRKIVDLGARHGEGYEAFGNVHPDASYVLVEPYKACYGKIHEVMDKFPQRDIEHVAGILGDDWGTREFITFPGDDHQSSNLYSHRDGKYGQPEKTQVSVLPYGEVLTDVDFAKINIEGAEYELIEHETFDNINMFVMEVHNGLYPGKGFSDVIEGLKDRYDLTSYGNIKYKYCFVSGIRCL